MMKHQELLEEVLQQNLQFQPNPRTIKQRIEAMIDRGYLERNTVDSSVYMYLA
jgi:cullin 1